MEALLPTARPDGTDHQPADARPGIRAGHQRVAFHAERAARSTSTRGDADLRHDQRRLRRRGPWDPDARLLRPAPTAERAACRSRDSRSRCGGSADLQPSRSAPLTMTTSLGGSLGAGVTDSSSSSVAMSRSRACRRPAGRCRGQRPLLAHRGRRLDRRHPVDQRPAADSEPASIITDASHVESRPWFRYRRAYASSSSASTPRRRTARPRARRPTAPPRQLRPRRRRHRHPSRPRPRPPRAGRSAHRPRLVERERVRPTGVGSLVTGGHSGSYSMTAWRGLPDASTPGRQGPGTS